MWIFWCRCEPVVRLPPSDGFSVQSVRGMLYNPLSRAWSWTGSTAINYALHAVKVGDDVQPDGREVEEEQEEQAPRAEAGARPPL